MYVDYYEKNDSNLVQSIDQPNRIMDMQKNVCFDLIFTVFEENKIRN